MMTSDKAFVLNWMVFFVSCKSVFLIPHATFLVPFRGQKQLEPRPSQYLLGVKTKIPDNYPRLFHMGVPPPPHPHILTTYQPHTDHIPTTYWPRTGHILTTFQPHMAIDSLSSTYCLFSMLGNFFNPCIRSLVSIFFQPCLLDCTSWKASSR